jgi:mycoredoxin-dependent peroxiredoxin
MPLAAGSKAPDFVLRRQTGEKVSLEDLLDQKSMIVFVPYPFTRTCTGELCQLRDNLDFLNEAAGRVVVITTHATSTNLAWARQEAYEFDILADYWPHGAVSRDYDAFDERHGYSTRVTYFLDGEGIIRDVVSSGALGEAREYGRYEEILNSY